MPKNWLSTGEICLIKLKSTQEYLQSLDAALKEGYQLEEVTKNRGGKI